ncbi:bifunctional UDP-N-acetylglucosamine diphosphorylase/glucosamine-1-phosphate N-acetyltransferase GlmU [Terrihabitans rhizophilus]|uniref:Bifunctional protein GlmU n=1 Tax=Terrihabitans rhizophilus TaxID=3092662 RepID=A0ABU4RKF4_9HYPH|nr:bifunctional UDP-N-acetylglucosamine diphosphorylase/glucosamine-1-phosphate N-acetyltransferase GlmU [Terrihabitans sp. PJ23]MDX6805328.1 bifunctional UDP-N-acetylglucosamine diphosphorylase/glucosamine-1-phosphate N-acetyltransferase GlmU [Terrihabitans sp. PJ23]
MAQRTCLTIVLAAGEGTRMRSSLPKVLHRAAGRTLLGHALASAEGAGAERLAVIVGPGREDVAAEAQAARPDAQVFTQTERLGTAHAVLAAREALGSPADDVLILFADTPLIRSSTLSRMRDELAARADIAVLGFRAADPTGYGRLIVQNGSLAAIREEKDASADERAIDLCNAGLMAMAGKHALSLLDEVGNANAKGEYYLTDVVEIARARGLKAVVLEAPEAEVQGVNTRAQLASAEAAFQQRLRAAALEAGVTLIAPETVFFSSDTVLQPDVLVEPNVVFGPGVHVESGAVIHAFSHLEGAHVGSGVSIGPFARLRPGASLAEGVRIGNFVEIKNAVLDAGVKVNHLAYVGDSHVGENANIGAGAITCNYDGVNKHRTEIGAGAFIGVNSALVAPVTIGEGAYVATGSIITENVPADALAVARSRQTVKPGWAEERRKTVTKTKRD